MEVLSLESGRRPKLVKNTQFLSIKKKLLKTKALSSCEFMSGRLAIEVLSLGIYDFDRPPHIFSEISNLFPIRVPVPGVIVKMFGRLCDQ